VIFIINTRGSHIWDQKFHTKTKKKDITSKISKYAQILEILNNVLKLNLWADVSYKGNKCQTTNNENL